MLLIDENKCGYTSHILLLTRYFEKSTDFNNAILALAKKYSIDKITNTMYRLYEGGLVIGRRDIKEVYKRYSDFLLTIDMYTGFYSYFYHTFKDGKLDPSYELFHNYVYEHRMDIKKIEALVEKMRRLDVSRIDLDETFNLEDVMSCNSNYDNNTFDFIYGNNIKALQTLPNQEVIYKTDGANYLVTLHNQKGEIKVSSASPIIVNDLLFCNEVLPDRFDYDNTAAKIIKAKNTTAEKYTLANPTVLHDAIDNLEQQTSAINEQLANQNMMDDYFFELKVGLHKVEALKKTLKDINDNNTIEEDKGIARERVKTNL